MQTKISVVIPTYKRPDLLMRCLQALSDQSIDKTWFEVIIVCDGPDPEIHKTLRPALKQNGLNVNVLNTTHKKGPAASRNLGWLSAKSPLIAFTDDDCIPSKDWLAKFLECYHGEALLSFSGQTIVPLPDAPTDFARNTARLETAEFITANCACTKLALYQTGGFDERFMMAWREDSDLHFKLLKLDIPIIKAKATVMHPVRQASWGISIKEQKKSIFEALLFRKYPELYRQRIAGKPIWNYYLINFLWLIIIIAILGNHTRLAIAAGLLQGVLFVAFMYRRLNGCSKSLAHISEMFFTSLIIPTLSLYWRCYGAFKYRVLFF